MNKVVYLENIKDRKAARRGFQEWQRYFPSLPSFNETTRFKDLPDEVISFLAEDEGGCYLLQDLIMRALDLGIGADFPDLPPTELNALLDLFFVLMDLVRFECMRRLGWLEEPLLSTEPIVTMIRRFHREGPPPLLEVPRIASGHPGYEEYLQLTPMDQQAFLRRSIPRAVALFKEKIGHHA
jgi:hypothetical protein